MLRASTRMWSTSDDVHVPHRAFGGKFGRRRARGNGRRNAPGQPAERTDNRAEDEGSGHSRPKSAHYSVLSSVNPYSCARLTATTPAATMWLFGIVFATSSL